MVVQIEGYQIGVNDITTLIKVYSFISRAQFRNSDAGARADYDLRLGVNYLHGP